MELTYPHDTRTRDRLSFLQRTAPALALFFLAPLCAEYLTGYLDSTGNFPALVGGLLFLCPLYGGAALTIREVTRRTGRGWLTIILLSFAFGVFQAGLVDHSLFNTSYMGFEWWEETLKHTYIPALGISANFALNFVIGHVIWSICAPIAIVEAFVPHQRTTPWLGNAGLIITIMLYGLVSALIFQFQITLEDFLPSTAQLVAAFAVVIAFTAAAFTVKANRERMDEGAVPTPWQVGILTLVLLSMVTFIELVIAVSGIGTLFEATWGGTLMYALIIFLLGVQVWRWSHRRGWGELHRIALAGGALLNRAWIAFLVEPAGDVEILDKLLHNLVFALGVIVLLVMATRRIRSYQSIETIRERETR